MATSMPLQFLDAIPARSLLAIQRVAEVWQRHPAGKTSSSIEVLRAGNEIVIVFRSPNAAAGSVPTFGVRTPSGALLDTPALEALMSAQPPARSLGRIEAASYEPMLAGVRVFGAHTPDWAAYQIELVAENSTLVVLFSDAARPAGSRGSVGKPGFEVQLDRADLKVLRANFVR